MKAKGWLMLLVAALAAAVWLGAGSGLTQSTEVRVTMAEKKGQPPMGKAMETYTDKYNGFTLKRPKGWRVVMWPGDLITVHDPSNQTTGALIWPLHQKRERPMEQLLNDFLSLAQVVYPDLKVLKQKTVPNGAVAAATVRFTYPDTGEKAAGMVMVVGDKRWAILSGYSAPERLLSEKAGLLSSILSSFKIIQPVPCRPTTVGVYMLVLPEGWRTEMLTPDMFTVRGDRPGIVAGAWGFNFYEPSAALIPPGVGMQAPYMEPAAFFTQLLPRIVPGFSDPKVIATYPLPEWERQMLPAGVNMKCLIIEALYTYEGIRSRGTFMVGTIPPDPLARATGVGAWTALLMGAGAPMEIYEEVEGAFYLVFSTIRVNWALKKRLDALEMAIRERERDTGVWERWSDTLGGVATLYDPRTGREYRVWDVFNQYWLDVTEWVHGTDEPFIPDPWGIPLERK